MFGTKSVCLTFSIFYLCFLVRCMFLFWTAISFTAIFDSGCLIWWGLEGWKRTKSREAGMWGLKPFRGTTSGIKPENEFLGFPRSRQRWGAKQPTHIPRLPKKKPLRGKKSASPKINCAYSLQNWILWCQPLKEYDFGVVNNISFNKQNCQPKSVHVSAYLLYDAVVFLW